ncbi:ABC transporter substrate-binding protein [Microlunatus speluncae]|uniref:ABC transporter substrate-binding protein n=1 Tax=Microlunatus speluncae TaxID=2594267 RepID=UPI001375617A|nr:ABC transporter substrate-binding protein [Microlunatus speluncae]
MSEVLTGRRRQGIPIMIALAVITLLITACGPGAGAEPTAADRPELTIEHTFGSTVLPVKPERVITFSAPWTDALIALDVPITAEFVTRNYSGDNGRFPWTPEHRSEVVVGDDIDYEKLAALQPELILAGYQTKETYDRLAAIAPTIPVIDSTAVLDTWQQVTETAGMIFDRQAEAAALITGVTQQIDAFRADFPAAAGKTFSYGQFTGDQFGLVAAATDPAARTLGELGLTLDPRSTKEGKGSARVLVSLEKVEVLAADLVIMWPLTGGEEVLKDVVGWSDLAAVRRGSYVIVDDTTASALASPSIYSVPWALEHQLRPAFGKLR